MRVLVEVRWEWLVLPALLVLLGDVFLILTIVSTKKARMAAWELSMLAPVCHELAQVDSDVFGYRAPRLLGWRIQSWTRGWD